MSSFCTNRRIAKSSFTPSKLRFRYLALHKNNLIISDFEVGEGGVEVSLENLRSITKTLKILNLTKFPNLPKKLTANGKKESREKLSTLHFQLSTPKN